MNDASGPDVVTPSASAPENARHHLRYEALTMALYVAICLLAELAALHGSTLHRGVVFELVWGTTMGLALAHLFAFLLAARLVEGRRVGARTRATALADLTGAGAVAVLVSAVVIVTPISMELNAARYDLAALIGIIGYVVARRIGVSALRAVVFAIAVTLVGVTVAALKQWLGGH
jgi:hypothetical protein